MLLRYSLFNSAIAAVAIFVIYFFDALHLLWQVDATRVSLLISTIYVIISVYIGMARWSTNVELVHFVSHRLTSLGLVGTVVGIMMLMGSVSTATMTSVQEVATPLFHGMSTLLITTLFGMVASLLIDFQVAFVFGAQRDDEPTD